MSDKNQWQISGSVDAAKLQGEFPKKGLRFPKQIEMPAFQTWKEIERQIERGGLTEAEQADLWDCLFLTLDEIDELLKHVKETARQPFIYRHLFPNSEKQAMSLVFG